MRVLVFEYLTAHGIGRDPAGPLHGMFREGRAMRDAVAADFRRLPDTEVETVAFSPGNDPEGELRRTARRCDYVVVIAPEHDGILGRYCRIVRQSTARLINPSPEAIELTSDKLALARHWRDHGVRTPATTDRVPTACEAFPVVWKPRDGAGSTATFLLADAFDVAQVRACLVAGRHNGPMIVQEFVPGRAASVAFLCGPAGNVPLLPTFQHLSTDGRFTYRGGELPIPPDLADRAARLATRAIDCVGGLIGYVGVDLILGDAPDGSKDYALEINPRLTTSYVGHRAVADTNLAEAMLWAAAGTPTPELHWKAGGVRFATSGMVSPTG